MCRKNIKMKRVITILIAAILVTIGCSDFSTTYQRIDADAFRFLNIMYEPAEAAPGEWVRLTAVFAGKKIDLEESIDWRVSYNVLSSIHGTLTAVDDNPLEYDILYANRPYFPNSNSTQAISIRFRIPEDVVRKSGSIPENWAELVPSYVKNTLPKELLAMTKTEMIDLIEACDRYFNDVGSITPIGGHALVIRRHPEPEYSDELYASLNTILQFFTAPIRISAHVQGEHTIQSTFSVRYNSRFHNSRSRIFYDSYAWPPTVNYNRNPQIHSVDVFKVKGRNQLSYDYSDPYITLWGHPSNRGVIEVEDGYTYLAIAYTYGSSYDWSVTLGGSTVLEEHHVHWQFQLDEDEIKGVPRSKYMDVLSVPGQIGQMGAWIIPPADRRITKFTMWVTVTDHVINERLRPQGSDLAEFYGMFVYK